MSSPTEQLIRDYLNRLSVAARGQLGEGDRRALVDRTREFIERKTGLGGRPTPLEVGKLLSGLGDPAGLVSQERQRLATLRGEPPEPVSRGRLARVLRAEPGKLRGASWHWPVQPGSRADLQFTLIDGAPAPDPEATAGAAAGREAAGPVAAEVPGQLAPKPAPPADPAAGRPLWPTLAVGFAEAEDIDRDTAERDAVGRGSVDRDSVDLDTGQPQAERHALDHQASDQGPLDHQGSDHQAPDHQALGPDAPVAAPGARATGLAGMNWQLVTVAPRRPSRSRQLLASMGGWSRRHKLEAVAIVLLGLGGVIFPPVWLLGAAVTIASRLWGYRDKWVALALPVLLTVVGTAVGISVGGQVSFGDGIHEGWVFAVDVSRATAVLSACYLGWRAARGPKPAVPPWDKPPRVT